MSALVFGDSFNDGRLFQDLEGGVVELCSCANSAGAGGGVAASLDLTIGHLSTVVRSWNDAWGDIHNNFDFDDTIPFNISPSSPRYVPMFGASFEPFGGWYNLAGRDYKDRPLVAKIQRFASGGYEVLLSWVDLERVGRAMGRAWHDVDEVRVVVKREQRQQNENDIIRSQARAKKNVRLKTKNMDCDRLLTLTRRETNPVLFWRLDDWSKGWKKFLRLCGQAGINLQYVAVPEMHEKGNYHLHVAISGNINVNIIRKFWQICCGGKGNEKGAASLGNVDISYKPSIAASKRRCGIAKYISKYITKQLGVVAFNKKRYWSSKTALPPVERYVMGGDCWLSGLVELAAFLGLDSSRMVSEKMVYVFPNESGLWFAYDERMVEPPPF